MVMTLSNSDHSTIFLDVVAHSFIDMVTDSVFYYDFLHADWDKIVSYISSIDFKTLFYNASDIETMSNSFYEALYCSIANFVPVKTVSVSHKYNRPHGFTYPRSIRLLEVKKLAAWRHYRRVGTLVARARYNKLSAECRRAIRSFVRRIESGLIDTGNLASFYRYSNKRF